MKFKGSVTIGIFILLVLMLSLGSMSFISSGERQSLVNNLEVQQLKHDANVLDRALAMWYKSHSNKYPANLELLKDIKSIPQTMDLNAFSYSVNADKTYNLIIKTPNGSTFKSPGSRQ